MQNNDKKNITFVLCNISVYMQYIWISDALDNTIYNISFILLDESTNTLKALLEAKNITCYQLQVNSKKDVPNAVYQTIKIFKKEKTSIVHTHLVDASLVGLLAAKIMGIKKRIHTRHHADFHHQHYKKGVIIDNVINYLSTNIVAISKNVKSIIEEKEKYHTNKVVLIYHGFNLDEFDAIKEGDIKRIKSKYNIDGFPVIGMISRYETGKGIEYCFHAFEKLLQTYPTAKLIIANAYGAEKDSIKQFLNKLQTHNFIEIEFEKEINVLYKCFDIFVHVPINATFEAFGQVYIEAMAASVPGIYTLSGIATEYIENNKNAIVVDYKSSDQIYNAMKTYLENPAFKEKTVNKAKKDVVTIFGINQMMLQLNKIYLD